ncbi:MAG: hypothetical protein RL662_861 [Bacteroidota bacterium]|jgi:hypothetical protein
MNEAIKKNWVYIAGAITGAIIGYSYWYHIGCNTGTCPIKSSSIFMMGYGATIGIFVFSLFKKKD